MKTSRRALATVGMIFLTLVALIVFIHQPPRSKQIFQAAMLGDLGQLKRCEANGVDLNIQDVHIFGWTPLMAAIYHQQTNIVHYLLAKNLNLNAQDNSGDTALMLAITVGDTNTVKSLLDSGADVTIRDRDGVTAFENARASPFHSLLLDWLNKKVGDASSLRSHTNAQKVLERKAEQ